MVDDRCLYFLAHFFELLHSIIQKRQVSVNNADDMFYFGNEVLNADDLSSITRNSITTKKLRNWRGRYRDFMYQVGVAVMTKNSSLRELHHAADVFVSVNLTTNKQPRLQLTLSLSVPLSHEGQSNFTWT